MISPFFTTRSLTFKSSPKKQKFSKGLSSLVIYKTLVSSLKTTSSCLITQLHPSGIGAPVIILKASLEEIFLLEKSPAKISEITLKATGVSILAPLLSLLLKVKPSKGERLNGGLFKGDKISSAKTKPKLSKIYFSSTVFKGCICFNRVSRAHSKLICSISITPRINLIK